MDWIYFHGNKTNPGKLYFQVLQLDFSIQVVISSRVQPAMRKGVTVVLDT